MHAKYRFELVRGEDRSIPITFLYGIPGTRKKEVAILSGLNFFMNVRDWRTDETIAELSSDSGDIVLGNLVDLEFIHAGESEDATVVLVNFSREITEKFTGSRAVYELFAVSRVDGKETRQCILTGDIKVVRGIDYV